MGDSDAREGVVSLSPGPRLWPGQAHASVEPLGNYAIHIIVKNGAVTLYGVVNNEVEKTKAALDVRQVFGVRSVDNQIQVVSDK